MRKNISKVLEAAIKGKPAQGDSKRTCWTDGRTVFSYRMPIAKVLPGGRVHIVERERAPSNTTRGQIDAARFFFGYLSPRKIIWKQDI